MLLTVNEIKVDNQIERRRQEKQSENSRSISNLLHTQKNKVYNEYGWQIEGEIFNQEESLVKGKIYKGSNACEKMFKCRKVITP